MYIHTVVTKRFWTHCAFVLYYTVSRFKDKAKTLVLLCFFFLVDNNRNIFKNLMTLLELELRDLKMYIMKSSSGPELHSDAVLLGQ